MIVRKSGLILALIGLLASAVPAVPASADGAASTRNIILGGALIGGTLLILNHNKKVHQKYDELTNSRNQAMAERDAAYSSASEASAAANSYRHQLAVTNRELATYKRTLASQHDEIMKLRHQVSLVEPANGSKASFVMPAAPVRAPSSSQVRVASAASYGWGML